MAKILSDKEYKKILDSMPICCVDLVINHKGKVLINLRNNEPDKGTWSIPGGRVYKGEKLEDAAIRKAYEETGLKVRIEKMIGVYETMFNKGPFKDLRNGVHTINICFLAKPINENIVIKLDKTSSNYKWVDKMEEDINPYAKKVIGDSKVL